MSGTHFKGNPVHDDGRCPKERGKAPPFKLNGQGR